MYSFLMYIILNSAFAVGIGVLLMALCKTNRALHCRWGDRVVRGRFVSIIVPLVLCGLTVIAGVFSLTVCHGRGCKDRWKVRSQADPEG